MADLPARIDGEGFLNPAPAVRLDALPERPDGWTKHLAMHLNFGSKGGSATYSIHDEQGRRVDGIAYGYDTRDGGGRGFFLTGIEQVPAGYLSWSQLRDVYARTYPQGR